jgi:hypothetical protein
MHTIIVGDVLRGGKLKWVLGIAEVILFLAGFLFAVDWMIFLFGVLWPGVVPGVHSPVLHDHLVRLGNVALQTLSPHQRRAGRNRRYLLVRDRNRR